ncbi:MAG: hypothetical protein QF357_12640, partial [Dehalococcoidia bacterium]|nr:hypothetical protein [Dehalococcoidia bacterium]
MPQSRPGHTTMVLKRKLGKSGATNYPGKAGSAWQASDGCGGDEDTPDVHYSDIMTAALGMADARMARIQADEAPETTSSMSRRDYCLAVEAAR